MNDAFLTSIKFYDREPILFMKLMKGNKNEYRISQIPLDCITCVGARFPVFHRYIVCNSISTWFSKKKRNHLLCISEVNSELIYDSTVLIININ